MGIHFRKQCLGLFKGNCLRGRYAFLNAGCPPVQKLSVCLEGCRTDGSMWMEIGPGDPTSEFVQLLYFYCFIYFLAARAYSTAIG